MKGLRNSQHRKRDHSEFESQNQTAAALNDLIQDIKRQRGPKPAK